MNILIQNTSLIVPVSISNKDCAISFQLSARKKAWNAWDITRFKLYNPNNNCPSEGHIETQFIFSHIYFITDLVHFSSQHRRYFRTLLLSQCHCSTYYLLPESTTINPFLLYMKPQSNDCVKPSISTKYRIPAKADVW